MFKNHKITTSFILLTLLAGIAATLVTWSLTKKELSDLALENARLIARGLDVAKIQKLTGSIADLDKPEYISINQKLRFIRKGYPSCRFLYLMGQKNDGTIFFFLDSQLAESKDAVLPGLIYDEVSDEYKEFFATGSKGQVVGPVTDRWGHVVTSLIPVYDAKGTMIAVLGADTNADDWNATILSRILFPVSLMFSIVGLTILFFITNTSRKKLVKLYREKEESLKKLGKAQANVKLLEGILPICANCKQIRDGEGYWNQVESYIKEHSEAEFTHSICPDCVKKLYPELHQKKQPDSYPG